MIRTILREAAVENPKLEALLPAITGNMGFVFTNGDLGPLRKQITAHRSPASAKTGVIAPITIVLPAGPTGLDPGQTSFFQAMNISTKITRGSIEILNPVDLVQEGEKVSASAVALLSKLNMKPFFFGIETTYVYDDGEVYRADILDITPEVLQQKFCASVRYVASLSLGASYPTRASLPHSIINAFRKMLAISLATDYTADKFAIYKEMLADPSKFASSGGGGDAKADDKPSAAAAAAPEEESEEEEEGFSLFD